MFRTLALFGMIVFVTGTANVGLAQSQTDAALAHAAKIKGRLSRFNPRTKIAVKVKGKGTLRGYVKEIGDEKLSLADSKRQNVIEIPYDQIKKVGRGTESPLKALAMFGAIMGAILLTVVLSLPAT
jgi:archaellum component FlaG (FlaF/FlaG flagellin family)